MRVVNIIYIWFCKYWKYIVFPVGLLFLLLSLFNKKKTISTPTEIIQELNTNQQEAADTLVDSTEELNNRIDTITESQVVESNSVAEDKKNDTIQDVVKWSDKF